MFSQVYRSDLDGPDLVRLTKRGDVVAVEYQGRPIDEVRLADVHRGVAISLGDGREIALMGGDGAERIVVKLDGQRLKPIVTSFNWVSYASAVMLGTAAVALTIAALAYLRVEWAWRLAIRREVLVVGLIFLALRRWRNPRAPLAGAVVLLLDVVYVLLIGISTSTTLVIRLAVLAFLGRAAFQQWQHQRTPAKG